MPPSSLQLTIPLLELGLDGNCLYLALAHAQPAHQRQQQPGADIAVMIYHTFAKLNAGAGSAQVQ